MRRICLVLVLVLAATTLGGCFFKPRRATTPASGGGGGITVQGQVVTEGNAPVPGAKVTVMGAQQIASTGPDGTFAIPGLAEGIQNLIVSKERYRAGVITVDFTQATVRIASSVPTLRLLLAEDSTLHMDSSRVPGLCGECHVLHKPTAGSHLTKGGSPNTPCFTCHGTGASGPIEDAVYQNSPHGQAPTNSNTLPAWPGQPSTGRGNCSTCHEPHGIAGSPYMLRAGSQDGDGTLRLSGLCLTCHELPGSGNTAGWPGKVAYLNAANLHVNAATVPASTRRSYPGTKYAMGDCSNCHLPHGRSGDQRMLRATGSALCIACHTDKVAGGGHDKCLMCHDPHVVTKTGSALNVKDPLTGTSMTAVPRENYRDQANIVSGDSYCRKCHTATPPGWVGSPAPRNPFVGTTGFKNNQLQSGYPYYQSDANLHNVHVSRVMSGSAVYDYHGGEGVTGDFNKVKCGQCHKVHQTSKSRNLNPTYFTSITRPYTGTYGSFSGNALQSKSGCGVAAGCHTCEWCHYAPGSPAFACYECTSYHSNSGHSGIVY